LIRSPGGPRRKESHDSMREPGQFRVTRSCVRVPVQLAKGSGPACSAGIARPVATQAEVLTSTPACTTEDVVVLELAPKSEASVCRNALSVGVPLSELLADGSSALTMA